MPGAAAAAVPRNCSCCKLQLQLLRPFPTPPLNCRSNCSQLFPGCNCSCSPLQLRSASQTAVAAVPKNCSCYKLQLQLSQSCSYPGLSPTRIESASETPAYLTDFLSFWQCYSCVMLLLLRACQNCDNWVEYSMMSSGKYVDTTIASITTND